MNNPFATSMVKMQAPANSGSCISASGFTVELDADGCVSVPQDVAKTLGYHGFTQYKLPEKADKPKAPAK